MSDLLIYGGKPLNGSVRVSGAKNSVLKMMAASILTKEPCILRNVPNLIDVQRMLELLVDLGTNAKWLEPGTLYLHNPNGISTYGSERLMREMRASILILGPLLARSHKAHVFYPGGCAIGPRPIDLHLNGLEALGASIEKEQGGVLYLYSDGRLNGARIYLDFPSVGATENLMMAAVLAEGRTIIENVAREPEVVELQRFLNTLGANVHGAGTDTIVVEGVEFGQLKGADYTVIPDRIEAGTFLIAGAITGGNVKVYGARADHNEALLYKLHEAGVNLNIGPNFIEVAKGPKARFTPLRIRTMPYPGFPTDLHPQMTALLALADGTSLITETVFPDRFKYVHELIRLGANISVEGECAIVKGVPKLKGAKVEATDLRGGAALVVAALAASGDSTVQKLEHLDRGYENLTEKLLSLGALVERYN